MAARINRTARPARTIRTAPNTPEGIDLAATAVGTPDAREAALEAHFLIGLQAAWEADGGEGDFGLDMVD